MTREVLAAEIQGARQALVSTLQRLQPVEWDAPSLCELWSVGDVVGHIVHQYGLYKAPYRSALAFAGAGLRVNRFLATEAKRVSAGRSPDDLVAAVEEARYEQTLLWKIYPWPQFALTEFVVHAQDIRRALSISEVPSESQIAIAARVFARPARANPFRTKLPAVRFEATDADWAYGDGPIARGPLEAIVMVLAGRAQAVNDLSGAGVALLRQALS